MKAIAIVLGVSAILASVPAVSVAACASPSVRVSALADLRTLLNGNSGGAGTGNTACVPTTASVYEAQEEHRSGGELWDYKRGPSSTVDPTAKIGTWSVTGRAAVVTYDYGGGTIYTYEVWDNLNGTHSFCRAGAEIVARIKSGRGGC